MWDRDFEIARMQVAERQRAARGQWMLRAAEEGRPALAQRLWSALIGRRAARRAAEAERFWERAISRADLN